MQYSEFVFESYTYDPARALLSLHYRFADGPRFEEQLIFDFPTRRLSADADTALDRIFRLIFLFSGVSYYKTFVPPRLVCRAFPLDRHTAEFLQNFYESGLAEFAWKNRISLQGHCKFDFDRVAAPAPIALELPRRTCVPVGGGKDSVVTLECLKASGEDLVLFSLGDAQPIAACIAAAGLPFIRVRRRLDAGVLKLNDSGALNGHVPITGILSAIVLACAVLSGFDTVAMSNEHSASSPNLIVDGVGSTISSASRWCLSGISLITSRTTFRRTSPISRCCGHCRKSRSPDVSPGTGGISEASAAVTRRFGNRRPSAASTGAAIVRNAALYSWP